jgi:uncharacterized protein YbjT (DUF2867 family)
VRKIVVIGGSGGLGRAVMQRLRTGGADAIAASRRTGFDLTTGEGLAPVLGDAEVIVHAARHPLRYRRVDLDGTRRMISVLQDRPNGRPAPHLVYVSIVGCDRNPYRYYRAKYASERVLERSGLPVTVVRATQFHMLVAAIARAVSHGPVALVPPIAFQSVDHRWVAEMLAGVALAEAPAGYRRGADLAGPELITLAKAVGVLRGHEGRAVPRMVTLPAIGGTLRSFAAGSNLPTPGTLVGGPGFSDWVDAS